MIPMASKNELVLAEHGAVIATVQMVHLVTASCVQKLSCLASLKHAHVDWSSACILIVCSSCLQGNQLLFLVAFVGRYEWPVVQGALEEEILGEMEVVEVLLPGVMAVPWKARTCLMLHQVHTLMVSLLLVLPE